MTLVLPDKPPPIPKDFTIIDLIDGLGGPSAFARICGFTENVHARGGDMRRRQSIKSIYWQPVVTAAHDAGYDHVTIETIMLAHQKPKLKKRPPRRRKRTSLV